MAYQFPPDVEKLLQEQMVVGGYRSEDDVLRDALKALYEQRHAVVVEDPAVVEGVTRGLADMKAGRSRPFEEFDVAFRANRNIPRDA